MGTRTSRHGHGRKPLYKEIDRNTGAKTFFFVEPPLNLRGRKGEGLPCTYCKRLMERTSSHSRVAATRDHYVPASAGGTQLVPCCRECNNLKGDMLPAQWEQFMADHPGWWKRQKRTQKPQSPRTPMESALAESVAQYLANRPRDNKPDFADQPFPMADVAERQQFNVEHYQSEDGGKLVAPSERDILMQLYAEKKITALQLRAGRSWQWDMEAAAIQPNVSIDWSEPRGGLHYQKRGDLTERQYTSMMRRRDFQKSMGNAALLMLDACLDVDRGRSELTFMFKCRGQNVDATMRQLLDLLSAATGMTEHQRRTWVWRMSAARDAGVPRSIGSGAISADAHRANTITEQRGRYPVAIERKRPVGTIGSSNFTEADSTPTRSH
jgi:hypothetical protein